MTSYIGVTHLPQHRISRELRIRSSVSRRAARLADNAITDRRRTFASTCKPSYYGTRIRLCKTEMGNPTTQAPHLDIARVLGEPRVITQILTDIMNYRIVVVFWNKSVLSVSLEGCARSIRIRHPDSAFCAATVLKFLFRRHAVNAIPNKSKLFSSIAQQPQPIGSASVLWLNVEDRSTSDASFRFSRYCAKRSSVFQSRRRMSPINSFRRSTYCSLRWMPRLQDT